ncbi:hypothetical protein Cyrtocomes_01123 [Candidatus Cyrtobacter comes]|uniref:Uncharacterized protein n=1 Tax=Candidatus Cyrtobacter comes TaxID=675776 RepID=A0ABU5LA53_9RICK|nr:hypothetical protein [Candidatus Cyrtobacter comes]MDZ5762729.1 hypothetical protein [Candidatus Cyrtobacter comes]
MSEATRSLCTQSATYATWAKDNATYGNMVLVCKYLTDHAAQSLNTISETTKSLCTQSATYATWAKDNATHDNMTLLYKWCTDNTIQWLWQISSATKFIYDEMVDCFKGVVELYIAPYQCMDTEAF